MYEGKKAIQSHFYVVFIVSFAITFLFVTLLGSVFRVDSPNCQYVEYDFISKCKDENGIIFVLKTEGDKKINFIFQGRESKDYFLEPKGTGKFRIYTGDVDDFVIVPYLESPIGGKPDLCEGKKEVVSMETLLKC